MRQTRKRFTLEDAVKRLLAPFFPRDIQGLIIAKLDLVDMMLVRRVYCVVAPVNRELVFTSGMWWDSLDLRVYANPHKTTYTVQTHAHVIAHARGRVMRKLIKSVHKRMNSHEIARKLFAECVDIRNFAFARVLWKEFPVANLISRHDMYKCVPMFHDEDLPEIRAMLERTADYHMRGYTCVGEIIGSVYPNDTPWPAWLTKDATTVENHMDLWPEAIRRGVMPKIPTDRCLGMLRDLAPPLVSDHALLRRLIAHWTHWGGDVATTSSGIDINLDTGYISVHTANVTIIIMHAIAQNACADRVIFEPQLIELFRANTTRAQRVEWVAKYTHTGVSGFKLVLPNEINDVVTSMVRKAAMSEGYLNTHIAPYITDEHVALATTVNLHRQLVKLQSTRHYYPSI